MPLCRQGSQQDRRTYQLGRYPRASQWPMADQGDESSSCTRALTFLQIAGITSGSRLQLAFELVEEAPIRAVGNNLVGARLDHTSFVQPQRIEPKCIFGIVLAPFVVRNAPQRPESIIIPAREAAIDESPRDPRGVGDTEVGCFEHGTERALGRNRMRMHKVPIAANHAAEI